MSITIRDRIKQLQESLKTDRWIAVHYVHAEWHPEQFGFFLNDADIDEIWDNPLLDKRLISEHHHVKDGVKCIGLGFGDERSEQ